MTNLADFLLELGVLSIEHLWLPLLFWTLFAGLFALADKFGLLNAPQIRYQAATALLFALPVGILLSFTALLSVSAPAPIYLASPETAFIPEAFETTGAATSTTAIYWQPYHLAGFLVLLIGCIGLFKTGVLLKETLYLRWMAKMLHGDTLATVCPSVDAVREAWDMKKQPRVVFSDAHAAPMTFGWLSPTIVVPESLRDQPHDLHMALLHELAHIRNADFARKWMERFTAAWFFFHPFVNMLVSKLGHFREMNCDLEVLSRQDVSPRKYASLLLNFAAPKPIPAPLPLSMSATKNNLKTRISAMKDYAMFSDAKRRMALLFATVLLFCTSLLVACEVNFTEDNSVTLITTPDGTVLEETEVPLEQEIVEVPVLSESELVLEERPVDQSAEIFMIVEEMPELIGGLAGIEASIKYPAIAKQAGIEGRVFVQFVVDTNGRVTDPVVVRGIGGGCDEEAIRAVQEARFVPGRQRGQAVKVKMSLPVTFRLSDEIAGAMQAELDLISKLMVETQLKMAESELVRKTLELKLVETRSSNKDEAVLIEKKLENILIEQSAFETQLKGLKEVYEKMLVKQDQLAS